VTATSSMPAAASRSLRASHQLVELEGLRAVAALAVLLTHAGFLSGATGRHVLPGFLARMDIGVALFFVLSGFLLYRPHARHVATGSAPPTVRTYAVRRTARLVPAWLAVLVGTLFLVPRSREAGAEVWAANLLQLQSLRLEWDLPGLAQLWSLSTEVMFYAALPLLALVVVRVGARRGWRAHLAALATFALASWSFRLLDGLGALPEGYSWLRTLPAMTDWFVAGMVLAVLVSDDRLHGRVAEVVRAAPWHLYAVAACVFWVLTTRIAGPYDLAPPTAWQASAKHLGYGIVATLVIAPSVLGARTAVSRVLSSSVLTYLGTISYGIFLWHLPIMFRVRDVLGLELFAFGFWITVGATFLASVVVAAASWHLLEAPVQTWARGRTPIGRGSERIRAPRGGERHEQEPQNA
jgi:peptidoglycan/LPS O-acetylase OafA/YrhL